jgi:hypothetical protein
MLSHSKKKKISIEFTATLLESHFKQNETNNILNVGYSYYIHDGFMCTYLKLMIFVHCMNEQT